LEAGWIRASIGRGLDKSELFSRRDAIKYIAPTAPAKERDKPQIRMAAKLLTRTAERSDACMMFARMAVMQALPRHAKRVFNPDRKDHHWGKRELERGR
jgi:hypothetical protein